ncbi:ATP-dependent Clp protease proteolytic subunit-related protein 3, chloroplastic-like [Populus trichocarpa]|uniref:ATP-dependent Clp protease proteolytic subunit-related protein 3, chloroplastic-like n=1 Tax=Populus trichocarpa TaxID=3694 RepID=UPI002278B8F8|nr:ATP-dependent Clp protease proteolytic subunit-related protein 3, chloroplastic-like [Populus trichocarpa]
MFLVAQLVVWTEGVHDQCLLKMASKAESKNGSMGLGKTHSSKFPNAKCPFVLGSKVGMETEGFAIHDSMMQLKNEKHTVAVGAAGAAGGQACLLLAAGTKGKRHMMPHAKAVIQQPRVPSSGLMPASDVLIRAKEVR